MLKKINRLSKRKDFQEIKELGKIYQSPIFGLALIKKEEEGKQFGFIISKKISKRAVDRNKIKRYLSQSIKNNLVNIPEGIRAVFLAKKDLLGKKYEEINEEVIEIIKKISNV